MFTLLWTRIINPDFPLPQYFSTGCAKSNEQKSDVDFEVRVMTTTVFEMMFKNFVAVKSQIYPITDHNANFA